MPRTEPTLRGQLAEKIILLDPRKAFTPTFNTDTVACLLVESYFAVADDSTHTFTPTYLLQAAHSAVRIFDN